MTGIIIWRDEYNIGNLQIDREHQELIKLANLLFVTFDHENSIAVFSAAHEALLNYVETHFRDEECLLESVDSKYLESQRKEHKALTSELRTFWTQDTDTPPAQAVHKFVKWVENRLLKHFLTLDYSSFHDSPFANK